jgi:hypothetical protein
MNSARATAAKGVERMVTRIQILSPIDRLGSRFGIETPWGPQLDEHTVAVPLSRVGQSIAVGAPPVEVQALCVPSRTGPGWPLA